MTLRRERTAEGIMSTPQFIYVMKGLRKVVPPNREILKGIWLSFYPGAKIGVVGRTGRARARCCGSWRASTGFPGRGLGGEGHAHRLPAAGAAAGPGPERAGQRGGGGEGQRDLLRRFDEVNMKFAEPMSDDEMQALIDEQARCRTASTPPARGTWTARSRSPWTRCGCRRPTRT
jgi:energy-dependent translational throttle protein EttA